MRLQWKEPSINIKNFEANEYISACVVGSIQCVYPGSSNGSMGDNGKYDDYFGGAYGGVYTDHEGKTHGICGYETPIAINAGSGTGYESDSSGAIQLSRPIYNISGYDFDNPTTGVYYDVTWTSNDKGIMGSEASDIAYHHKGRLTVTYIDNNHPNRS